MGRGPRARRASGFRTSEPRVKGTRPLSWLVVVGAILGCARSQGNFFENAVLVVQRPSHSSDVPSVMLRSGDGTVLRIVHTISGDWWITDTRVDRVLLVGLERYTVGVPIDVADPDVTLWFRGREPVLKDRGGLVATRGTGTVTILAASDATIDVDLRVRLDAASMIVRTARTEVAVDGRFHLRRGDGIPDVTGARRVPLGVPTSQAAVAYASR